MTEAGDVSEVELRTVPNVREHADASTFVKDYMAFVDDTSKKLSKDLVERQFADVRQTAMQRGLRPTGDPKLIEARVVNKNNVVLVYSVDVVVAATAPEITDSAEKAAVASEQTATGADIEPGEGAATADGKTVDTSAPEPPATGAPKPDNAKKSPGSGS